MQSQVASPFPEVLNPLASPADTPGIDIPTPLLHNPKLAQLESLILIYLTKKSHWLLDTYIGCIFHVEKMELHVSAHFKFKLG
jgi:hypothetical protein